MNQKKPKTYLIGDPAVRARLVPIVRKVEYAVLCASSVVLAAIVLARLCVAG